MVDRFLTPIPEAFLKDAGVAEWARQVTLYLDELSRPDGVLDTSETTTETVLTQGQKLDQITITQAVNLDTVEAQAEAATTALADLRDNLPKYAISNDGTLRTLNADAALIVAGAAYSQTEQQQLIDAFGALSDVLSTVIRDLKNKQIFGV